MKNRSAKSGSTFCITTFFVPLKFKFCGSMHACSTIGLRKSCHELQLASHASHINVQYSGSMH